MTATLQFTRFNVDDATRTVSGTFFFYGRDETFRELYREGPIEFTTPYRDDGTFSVSLAGPATGPEYTVSLAGRLYLNTELGLRAIIDRCASRCSSSAADRLVIVTVLKR